MKSILTYFIKDYKFNSDLELIRVKSFVIIIFSAIVLLLFFMLRTILIGYYSLLYTQYLYLAAGLFSLYSIKKGYFKNIGNFISLLIVLTEIFALFSNMSGAKPFNFFVDEFYIFIVFLFFSSMFAERFILIINSILILSSSFFAYYYYKDSFQEGIVEELYFGFGIYILAVISVTLFNYLFSYIIFNAIKEISDKAKVSESRNKELALKQKQLENKQIELINAKDKAEENDRLKSIFLANMSHEIRTPMNAILGFTHVLKDTSLSDKQNEYVEVIEDSGKHLLNLIEDILEISKFEANKLKIKETDCNINNLIKDVVRFFELSFKKENKSNIKISASYGLVNGKENVITDCKRLRQILINLISNSVKFTLTGSIFISYKKKTENELLFSVKDTGIGIKKSQIPIIFERFRQADESTTKQFGGTGLGLAIAKACVDLLKGNIWVESEKGKGSEFFFTIPYNVSSI